MRHVLVDPEAERVARHQCRRRHLAEQQHGWSTTLSHWQCTGDARQQRHGRMVWSHWLPGAHQRPGSRRGSERRDRRRRPARTRPSPGLDGCHSRHCRGCGHCVKRWASARLAVASSSPTARAEPAAAGAMAGVPARCCGAAAGGLWRLRAWRARCRHPCAWGGRGEHTAQLTSDSTDYAVHRCSDDASAAMCLPLTLVSASSFLFMIDTVSLDS